MTIIKSTVLPFRELETLILLARLSLTGSKTIHQELISGVSPLEILRRVEEENLFNKAEVLKELRGKFDPAAELEKVGCLGGRVMTILDADYPFLLKQITDPPLVLYLKGTLIEPDRVSVAIVGTRHPSFYGIEQTQKFSSELARSGLTIVSGFAKGVDQKAHQAALTISHGRTLGVLGCGLDVDYPKGSAKLFESICERGAMISEYAMGTPPLSENFPRRNRIIAGLALGTLVIEAHTISGSLITARLALEEGREVFSLPGPVDRLTSRGTNQLIKEGAMLADCPEEISKTLVSAADQYRWIHSGAPTNSSVPIQAEIEENAKEKLAAVSFKNEPVKELSEEEIKILNVLEGNPSSSEEIGDRLGISGGSFTGLLTILEIRGYIKRLPEGQYIRTS